MNTRALGWIPDEPDDRDLPVQEYLVSTPARPERATSDSDISLPCVEVLDQGMIGSCVANMGSQMLRMSQIKQANDELPEGHVLPESAVPPLASRLFSYHVSRAYHGATKIDSGTHIRFLFKGYNEYGFLPEQDYPYENLLEKVTLTPRLDVFQKAFDQSKRSRQERNQDILYYYRLYETGWDLIERINELLEMGIPIGFGAEITRRFQYGMNSHHVYGVPTKSDVIVGGHAQVISGRQKKTGYLEILGSWGSSFGLNGRTFWTPEYIMSNYCRDFWIVKAAPFYSHLSVA